MMWVEWWRNAYRFADDRKLDVTANIPEDRNEIQIKHTEWKLKVTDAKFFDNKNQRYSYRILDLVTVHWKKILQQWVSDCKLKINQLMYWKMTHTLFISHQQKYNFCMISSNHSAWSNPILSLVFSSGHVVEDRLRKTEKIQKLTIVELEMNS